jgi:hypothetical protein
VKKGVKKEEPAKEKMEEAKKEAKEEAKQEEPKKEEVPKQELVLDEEQEMRRQEQLQWLASDSSSEEEGGGEAKEVEDDQDTYVSVGSYGAALRAAGVVMQAVDRVVFGNGTAADSGEARLSTNGAWSMLSSVLLLLILMSVFVLLSVELSVVISVELSVVLSSILLGEAAWTPCRARRGQHVSVRVPHERLLFTEQRGGGYCACSHSLEYPEVANSLIGNRVLHSLHWLHWLHWLHSLHSLTARAAFVCCICTGAPSSIGMFTSGTVPLSWYMATRRHSSHRFTCDRSSAVK